MVRPRWRDWARLSEEYAQYHRHPLNRLCHAFGIPLIAFCVIRWTLIPQAPIAAAVLAIPLYLMWDAALGAMMAALILSAGVIAASCPGWIFVPLFVLGWFLQLLGHSRYEKRSPAFSDNLIHLLVGPLWILREAAQKISLR